MPSAQTIADLAIEFSSFGLADLERDIDRALKAGGAASRKTFQPSPMEQSKAVFDQLLNDQRFLQLSGQEQFDIQQEILKIYGRQAEAQHPIIQALKARRKEEEAIAATIRERARTPRDITNEGIRNAMRALKQGRITMAEFNAEHRRLVQNFRAGDAEMNRTAKSARMTNMKLAQLSFGVQDLSVVLAGGGPNSLERALIAASNNFAQIAALSGTASGAAAGVALTLGSILLPKLLNLVGGAQEVKDAFSELSMALKEFDETVKALQFGRSLKHSVEDAAAQGLGAFNKAMAELDRQIEDRVASIDVTEKNLDQLVSDALSGMTPEERFTAAVERIRQTQGEEAARAFQARAANVAAGITQPGETIEEAREKVRKRRDKAASAAVREALEFGTVEDLGLDQERVKKLEDEFGQFSDDLRTLRRERDQMRTLQEESERKFRPTLVQEEARQAGVKASEHFKKMAQDRADEFQKEQDARNKFQEGLDKFLQSPLDKVDKLRHKTADWLDAIDEKVGQQLISVGQGDANRLSVLRKQEGAVQEIIGETEKKIKKLTSGKTEFFGLSDFAKRIQESIGQDDTAEQLKKLQDIQQRALQTLKDIRDEINLPGTFTP